MSFWKSLVLVASFGFLPSAFADANAAFARLQAMAGTWNVTTAEGSGTATYSVVSGGNAVMEVEADMVTMYYLDGDTLMATHYCDAGNEPRMRATNFGDPNALEFDFVDITNLQPGGSHISGVALNWQDDDNVNEVWSYDDGQGNISSETFALTRAGGN